MKMSRDVHLCPTPNLPHQPSSPMEGAGRGSQLPEPIGGWPYEGSWLPVWQLCSHTRCPSYLQWHRIMLFEKSDSATSNWGFTTTCRETRGQVKAGDDSGCDHHLHYTQSRKGCLHPSLH